ncbi:hypothetical protein PLESTB_001013400 [Pleodorina starrii]|uniref:Uncharacterized protein n=1 Tax=Pleodorina starrii TaxID=330485 RepID=A0A9W6BPM5_9CHLO|nr:hypothetical protein PLESTM_001193900 [Pleodorina starrii]GLC55675.1 hypothetical protein PLESTB_001013400 [Pleodorina starrii]GLC65425.1 hypothetical protein PLESTF_000291900 [Pleodorina starrii]
MIPITFEESIGYFGVYIFLVCVCLSLAVALYYLAELVEEHLKTTKKVILYTIQAKLALLALLWVLEGVDVATMVPTIAAPLGYWRVVARTFPFMSFRDPLLALSGLSTVAAHLMWMRYHMNTFHHVAVLLGFFLVVVWLVPFQLLISLAANENCLPGAASGMPNSFYGGGGRGGGGAGGSGGGRGGGGGLEGRGRGTRTWLGSLFDRVRGTGTGKAKGKGKDRDW